MAVAMATVQLSVTSVAAAGEKANRCLPAKLEKNCTINTNCSRLRRVVSLSNITNPMKRPNEAFFRGRVGTSRSSSSSSGLHAYASKTELRIPPKSSGESKVIVIDNYDSFTYNLCQYLGDLGCSYDVVRNDEITIDELIERRPRGILISPGPGRPQDSGIAMQSIERLGNQVPIFGVCMGLQCMGEVFGGKIVRSPHGVVHGKTSPVFYDEHGEAGLLDGLPNPFKACRYHSLVIEKESFPADELEITAWTEDGLIMGVRHKKHRYIQGVQFHPESIITESGKKIVANFVKLLEQKEASDKHEKVLIEV